MAITKLGIVGGGLMGAGIAEVATRAGVTVVLREVDDALAGAARGRIEKSLGRGVDRGKLTADERDAALARLIVTTELAGLAGCGLVVEAVVEDRQLKEQIFAELDRVVEADDAVLASNTSSIPIMQLAVATSRPEAVVGLHFFNPVPVMELVEVIPSIATSEDTLTRAMDFAGATLGKKVVRAPDRAGFIVNALLIPYLLDAIRMYEAGHATAEDIDAAMQAGANHPIGPLALCDLIGNDTMLHVADAMYAETGDARLAAPQLLRRMVEAGRLGRKTGQGFY